ncbi:hypothetical protein T492DRAFT_1110869 [Pavlovales sp. CCMP2436]|nr:hypothetical protein T492DRAFT_1110869 [Pavlovales sp. CCMP2436]
MAVQNRRAMRSLLCSALLCSLCASGSAVRAPRLCAALTRSRLAMLAEEVSLGGLFRRSEDPVEGVEGDDPTSPVILQHSIDRLILPGQTSQLHLYDSSNLAALRSAMTQGSTFIHVALDPATTAKRKFGISAVGTEVRVLTVAPSSKLNFRGESSSSIVIEAIGLRQRRVLEVTTFEPHVRARIGPVLGGGGYEKGGLAELRLDPLEALAAECHNLRVALQLESALLSVEAMRASMLTAFGAEGEEVRTWTCVRLCNCVQGLSPERRLSALQICEPAELLQYVHDELTQERQRLLACKALKSI